MAKPTKLQIAYNRGYLAGLKEARLIASAQAQYVRRECGPHSWPADQVADCVDEIVEDIDVAIRNNEVEE